MREGTDSDQSILKRPRRKLLMTFFLFKGLPFTGQVVAGGSRRSPSVRRNCSERANFGKPLDGVFVVPADGGFPCCRCLRGDVIGDAFQTGCIVGQDEVKVGHVDMLFEVEAVVVLE